MTHFFWRQKKCVHSRLYDDPGATSAYSTANNPASIFRHFPTVLREGRGGVSTTQNAEWMLDNVTFSDAVTRAGMVKYLKEIKTIKPICQEI